jgi:hypothetical protein
MKDYPRIANLFLGEWNKCIQQMDQKKGFYYEKYVFADPKIKHKTVMWDCEVLLQRIITDYPDVTSMPEYAHWAPVVEAYKMFKPRLPEETGL